MIPMGKFSIYLTDPTKEQFDSTLSHIIDSNGKTIARGKAIEILINHLTPTYHLETWIKSLAANCQNKVQDSTIEPLQVKTMYSRKKVSRYKSTILKRTNDVLNS